MQSVENENVIYRSFITTFVIIFCNIPTENIFSGVKEQGGKTIERRSRRKRERKRKRGEEEENDEIEERKKG